MNAPTLTPPAVPVPPAGQPVWDVAIIGAGLGGGLCGRMLAEAGLSVLFIERGRGHPRRAGDTLDCTDDDPEVRRAHDCWPERLRGTVDGRSCDGYPLQGTGLGGTSVYYAAALERPERHDLEPTPTMPHPTGGWPVGYDAFTPWFDRAQALMALSGTPDPLRPEPLPPLRDPPVLSPAEAVLVERMRAAGLHPYRTHLAIRGGDGCRECVGCSCPRDCKMDGRSAGIEPALATGRAAVLDGAVVRRLGADRHHVTHAEVECGGEAMRIEARVFVLAAGALASPMLLLASASDDWPEGLANDSGLAGRFLMFHVGERIALWAPRGLDHRGPRKTISLRDFYTGDGARLGLVQSLGVGARYGVVVHELKQRYDRSPLRRFRAGKPFIRIPAAIASALLGEASVFATIVEDLPDPENRVTHDPAHPNALTFTYRIPAELRQRSALLRRKLRAQLCGIRMLFLSFQPELNLAHPCGTLRFSDDPAQGVLDRDCRAHGVDNLYVADASFMPTSTGVNPSLTIVANALRVADIIVRRHASAGAAEGSATPAPAPAEMPDLQSPAVSAALH